MKKICFGLAMCLVAATGCQTTPRNSALSSALTFHASFDHALDADLAAGDPVLRSGGSMSKPGDAKPGLSDSEDVQWLPSGGRYGRALRFNRKQAPFVFFRGTKNMPYRTNGWSGTVSFWLSADPADLPMSFCDPIQITPRAWNDAAFFVEFEKRTNDIPFRLGVYPDFKIWNPTNKKWENVTREEKPLVDANTFPFARGKWTHIAFTFTNFNTGRDDGVARLYLDGQLAATLGPRRQTFTWEEDKCLIALGLSYIGLWDELAIFNRALSAEEIRALRDLPNGAADLHRGRK
jgi:hypothetical protein